MTMAMGCARCMSIRCKDSVSCFELVHVLSGVSRKKNCRFTSRSSISFTTRENEEKRSSIRSLSDFWHDLPRKPYESSY